MFLKLFIFLKPLLLIFMTDGCFEKIFIDFELFDGDCLKAIISKCLGIGIVAGSICVKVPQILKIVSAKSAEGLSLLSIALELIAVISATSYNYVNGYPFSSYGDSTFLIIQNGIIGGLILLYAGCAGRAQLFLGVVAAATAVLCSGAVPLSVLWLLQASNIPVVVTAKMLQAWSNYSAGSTGQLSAVTLTLLTAGSAARIFTSIQETGDSVIIATYCFSTIANSILFGQLIYYWGVGSKDASKKEL